MRRTLSAVLVVVGMAVGFAAAHLVPESVVSAQTGWQCKSWTLEKQEDTSAVGTWLGQARNAQIAAAGLSVAGRFTVVACKQ
jgi:hypothetical protein